MKNENQMNPSPYIPITPDTRIPFPCWLWHPLNEKWRHFDKWEGRYPTFEYDWTHYCTSATEPTGRLGEEVKEANSYFPPSALDKWTHTSNEDLNRYFAREFWNRPIDERNNTYWHDDDKTSEDDNHEWKPLPDFCNDWPAVRKILRDSKVVVPPDFHGRDPSEICRRTMIYMLMSKNPTSEQPQSAVPTASGATGEGFDKIDNNQWAKRLFSLAKELGQSEFSSEPPDCFIRRTLPSNPASGATGEALRAQWNTQKAERDQLTTALAEAKELLREIRDNEVNAIDEADKFLRDHVPSELSKAKARAVAEVRKQIEQGETLVRELENRLSNAESHISDMEQRCATQQATIQEVKAESNRLRNILQNPSMLRHHVQKQFPEYAWENAEYIGRLRALAEQSGAQQATIARLTKALEARK